MKIVLFSLLICSLSFSQAYLGFYTGTTGPSIVLPKSLNNLRLYLAPGGFNTSTNKDWIDSSGNGLNFSNGSALSTDVQNGITVPQFSGSTMMINNGNPIFNFPSKSFTWIMVFKATAGQAYQTMAGCYNGSKLLMWGIEATSEKFLFYYKDGSVANSTVTDLTGSGTWNIVAVTFNSYNDSVKIFMKGLKKSVQFTVTPVLFNDYSDGIGATLYQYNYPYWAFFGDIGAYLVYTDVKSDAEINGVCGYLASKFNLTWVNP